MNPLLRKGTTTVGLVCRDDVILATDTRVMEGLFIAHRSGKKIYRIDDHLGMTIAGIVADAQNVVDTLKYFTNLYRLEKKRPIPVKAAARMTANVLFGSRLFPYIADVLVAGYDGEDGNSIYNIDLFGSLTPEMFVSTGSGSPVAYGILESEYRPGLSTEEGLALAVKAVTAAMKRNAGTGDDFNVAIIGRQPFRELSEEEKARILKGIAGRT